MSFPPQGDAPVISGGDFLPPGAGFDLGSVGFPWAEAHVTTLVFGGTVTGNWNPSDDETYYMGIPGSGWLGVRVNAGLVGTPPYTFEGDLNTGVYLFAADTLGLAVGGVGVSLATFSTANSIKLGVTMPAAPTGDYNCIFGIGSGTDLTDGEGNTLFGVAVGQGITTGDYNNGFGDGTLQADAAALTGSYNNGFGDHTLVEVTSGASNSAFGGGALNGITTGSNNTGVGRQALQETTSSDGNTAVGFQAGLSNETGARNIFLGTQAGFSETGSDRFYVGSNGALATNAFIYGVMTGTPYLFQLGSFPASAGVPLRDGPTFQSMAHYWNGAASTEWAYGIFHDMTASGGTPASRVIHSINAVDILTLVNTNGTANVVVGTGEGGLTAATGLILRAPSVIAGGAGNVVGADLTITPGAGTGVGDAGQIIFQTYQVAAAGDNLQTTLETILTLDEDLATFAKPVSILAPSPTTIQNTTDAASNQVLSLGGGNRAVAANNDEAYISFMLDNDAETQYEFGRLTWIASDVGDAGASTSSDSQFSLEVRRNDALVQMLAIGFLASSQGTVVFNNTALDVNYTWNTDFDAMTLDGGTGLLTFPSGQVNSTLSVGISGSATGVIEVDGATSGVVTVTVAAAAGTWTMTLPVAVGGAGNQLTDAAGNGVTSWAAAASLREAKTIMREADPREALDAILGTKAYHFHYREGMGTQDSLTEYVGVMADEAPWAMHYGNTIVNPVNTLGYMVMGFQAVDSRVAEIETKLETLQAELAALGG